MNERIILSEALDIWQKEKVLGVGPIISHLPKTKVSGNRCRILLHFLSLVPRQNSAHPTSISITVS